MSDALYSKLDSLDEAIASAGAHPDTKATVKRRGRPRKSATPPPTAPPPVQSAPDTDEPDPKTVEALRRLFRPLGQGTARAFDVEPLSDDEVDTLAEGWALLTEQYMEKFGQHSAIIMAATSTFVVAAPRVAEYYEKKSARAKRVTESIEDAPKMARDF